MALISSSPGPEYHPHRLFRLQHLIVQPSSPSLDYGDGQLSPSFDASFASSMSISSADPPLTTASNDAFAEERHSVESIVGSSPVQMDISPAPYRDTTSITARLAVGSSKGPPPPLAPFGAETQASRSSASASSAAASNGDYPFLRNLFQSRPVPVHHNSTSSLPAALGIRAPSPLPETAPLSLKSRRDGRPSLQHAASAGSLGLKGPFELKGVQSGSSLREAETFETDGNSSASLELGEEVEGPMNPPRIQSKRSALPAAWNKPPSRSRHTAPAGSSALLKAPPAAPLPKRKSEPLVPTFQAEPESSPFRMDVDGASPNGRLSSPVSLRPPQHPRSVSDSRASDRDLALAREDSNPFFFPSGSYSPPRSNVVLENPESGASDRLADLFADDLSPIPQSRKRFLEEHHSPTPASPTPSTATNMCSLFGAKPSRRSFEKAMSTTCIPQQGPIRRQRSSHALQLKKRPSLSSFASAAPSLPTHTAESAGPTTTTFGFKRHAPAINGKPKSMRRAFSVADAAPNSLLRHSGSAAGKENHDSATTTVSYRSSLCNASTTAVDDEIGYFPPLSSGRRVGVASMDLGSSTEKQRPLAPPETGSPVTGFRSQEAKGKALPCFGVKEDGLMRISAATLNDVQAGIYSTRIKRFVIIDCRFDYEFEGGHITNAINLSDVADVDKALLSIPDPPAPSTSEYAPSEGKTVLIFHCEFSAKRAPTTAKHLRNQDRLKNHLVYPNIHYPEVYVLQGGYAEFFKSFPERCIGGYLEMDDPARLAERSVNLNHFRNQIQKRQFQRANTFTFGQAQHASTLLQAATTSREMLRPKSSLQSTGALDKSFAFPSTKEPLSSMSACHEEQEHEADSSFGTQGSSPGGGDSPCPTSKVGRGSLKLGKDFGMLSMTGASGPAARRGLERAQTSATLMFTR